MNTRTPLIASALLAVSLISGTAHAALEGRDLNGSIDSFEAYYDTDLNITWLANANIMNAKLSWASATNEVAYLSFHDAVNNITYDNWRLPRTLQPDASCSPWGGGYYGCTGSEMGHLFYRELGGIGGHVLYAVNDAANLAKFTNLKTGPVEYYWSDTPYALSPDHMWSFTFFDGKQVVGDQNLKYTFAVSDGDVGIAAIPEPETYAMMLAGLGLVGAMARRRKIAKV